MTSTLLRLGAQWLAHELLEEEVKVLLHLTLGNKESHEAWLARCGFEVGEG